MILRPLQPAEAFYRFNTPRWSYRPTSGAGAAKVGGRFNRPGIEALYLSRSVETGSAEYQQDEPLMPPGTLVTYRIALSQVVDFQKGYVRGEWDELWADWHCEWRKLALYEEIEPPSWLLGDIAIECGSKGILFPSTRHAGGSNVVVFTQQLDERDELSTYDPHGDLPRNQDSWRDQTGSAK
jgi:RES domain-containing protein